MRRFERRRLERLRRRVSVVGLSFAIGVLTNHALTWRLQQGADPEPLHDPAEPRAVATTGTPPPLKEVEALRRRALTIPVEGVQPHDLRDTFADARGGGRTHEAIDIMAPRHTPVVPWRTA